MIHISKNNSKIGKILNISMTPIKSCGNCSACARDCYALKAYRQYKATKTAWDDNYEMAVKNRDEYFEALHAHLVRHAVKLFRWHVAGDILDDDYLARMKALARLHSGTKFLAFTKMFKLDYSDLPSNLVIVLSMWVGMPEPKLDLPKAWYQDGTETRIPAHVKPCRASKDNNVTCETCTKCFNLKAGQAVYFKAH